jgi:hypothetical protein
MKEDIIKTYEWDSEELEKDTTFIKYNMMIEELNKEYVVKINKENKPYLSGTDQGNYHFIDNVECMKGFENKETGLGNERLQISKNIMGEIQQAIKKTNNKIITLSIKRITPKRTIVKILGDEIDISL